MQYTLHPTDCDKKVLFELLPDQWAHWSFLKRAYIWVCFIITIGAPFFLDLDKVKLIMGLRIALIFKVLFICVFVRYAWFFLVRFIVKKLWKKAVQRMLPEEIHVEISQDSIHENRYSLTNDEIKKIYRTRNFLIFREKKTKKKTIFLPFGENIEDIEEVLAQFGYPEIIRKETLDLKEIWR